MWVLRCWLYIVCRIQANIRFELNDFGMNAIALLGDAQYLHSRIVTKKETKERIQETEEPRPRQLFEKLASVG